MPQKGQEYAERAKAANLMYSLVPLVSGKIENDLLDTTHQ